jgi:hypothetical protein
MRKLAYSDKAIPPPARVYSPSYVHSSSQTPDLAAHRMFGPSLCQFWYLCCPKRCSCRGTRRKRRVLRSIVFGLIVLATRMRHRMFSLDPPRPLAQRKTSPCLTMCEYSRWGRGGGARFRPAARVSVVRQHLPWASVDGKRAVRKNVGLEE